MALVTAILTASLCGSTALAQSSADLQDRAVRTNPSVAALRAAERSLIARAEVVGTWSDPVLSVEYSNAPIDNFGLSSHPMSGIQLKLQQSLHPPGWSRLQREADELRAQAGAFTLHEAELQLRATVDSTWWMLRRTRDLRRITEDHLARTAELQQAAEARYETGSVGQHAVLRLQVLQDRLKDELEDFVRTDVELTSALNQALGEDSTSTFATDGDPAALPVPDPSNWIAIAQQHRPLLKHLQAERSAAERSADFARADAIPDITVWAGYRLRMAQTPTDPGTDFVSLGVGVPLPVASTRKQKGMKASWIERASSVGSRIEATHNAIDADMARILAGWSRAWSKSQTYADSLLPGAQNTLEAAEAEFSVGRADFASLFEAEVTLLNLERARVVAATQTHISQAQATAVLGIPPTTGAQ